MQNQHPIWALSLRLNQKLSVTQAGQWLRVSHC
ncbi:Uncharacterised protein [Vibrio cholerae]|nr:Uncharacterised protein [Vibrio cholerae]